MSICSWSWWHWSIWCWSWWHWVFGVELRHWSVWCWNVWSLHKSVNISNVLITFDNFTSCWVCCCQVTFNVNFTYCSYRPGTSSYVLPRYIDYFWRPSPQLYRNLYLLVGCRFICNRMFDSVTIFYLHSVRQIYHTISLRLSWSPSFPSGSCKRKWWLNVVYQLYL